MTAGLPYLLLALAALLMKWPELFLPMGEDQGIFNLAAGIILRGGVLYRDLWETKPPAEYYLHAAVLAPLSDPWQPCWLGSYQTTCGEILLHAVDLVYSVGIGLATVGAARLVVRPRFAWAAGLLAVLHVNAVLLSREGSTPEKHALLPMALAAWAYLTALRRRGGHWAPGFLLAGTLVGLAALFKPPAAVMGLAMVVHLVARTGGPGGRRAVAPLLLVGGGGLLALVPLLLYLALNDLWRDFWEQAIAFNLGQAGTRGETLLGALVEKSWQVFGQSSGLLWVLAALGAGLGARRRSAAVAFARWWAAACALAVLAGGAKLVTSYFLYLVPPCAVLAAVALQDLWHRAPRLRALAPLARAALLAACALGLLATAGFQRGVVLRVLHERWPAARTASMEEWLATDLLARNRGASLYIWGGSTSVYLLAGVVPPTRHVHAAFLSRAHSTSAGYIERRSELMRDLRRRPPEVFLVSPMSRSETSEDRGLALRTFPELQAFLDEHYAPFPLGRSEGWRAYRLAWYERFDERAPPSPPAPVAPPPEEPPERPRRDQGHQRRERERPPLPRAP